MWQCLHCVCLCGMYHVIASYWCVCVQCFNKLTEQRCPLRINEVLTPKACLTLLAYTLILEEPYSVHPFFVFTLPAVLVTSEYIDHYIFDLHWVRHGNLLSDRVSAEIILHSTPQCTLECLIAYYSFAFTIPMHSD